MKFKDVTYGEDRLVDIEIRWSNTACANLALVCMRQRICADYLDWCERMNYPKPFNYDIFNRTITLCDDGDFDQPQSFRLTRKEALRMGLCLLKFALFNRISG